MRDKILINGGEGYPLINALNGEKVYLCSLIKPKAKFPEG